MVERNFLSPKLSSDARPEGVVQAASPIGPLSPLNPTPDILPAVNPGVASQVGRERLLDENQQAPRGQSLAAFGQVIRGIGGLVDTLTPSQSEEDQKNELLRPLAEKFNNISQGVSQGRLQGGLSKANVEARAFLTQFPALENEVSGLYKTYFGREISATANPEAALDKGFQDYLESPVGQMRGLEALALPEADRYLYQFQGFQQYTAERAQDQLIANTLARATNTNDLNTQSSQFLFNEIVPQQLNKTIARIGGLISQAEEGAFNEDILTGIRQMRAQMEVEYTAQYSSSGIVSTQWKSGVEQALAPIDAFISLFENNAEDLNTLVGVKGDQAILTLQNIFKDNELLSNLMITREGQRYFLESLIVTEQANIAGAIAAQKNKLKVFGDGTVSEDGIFNKDYIDSLAGDPETRKTLVRTGNAILGGANLGTAEGRTSAYRATEDIIAPTLASPTPLAPTAFSAMFLDNVPKFIQLTKTQDEQGVALTTQLNELSYNEFRKNYQVFGALKETMPVGFMLNVKDGVASLEFNVDAFNRSDDELTVRVRKALTRLGYAPTAKNVQYVLSTPQGAAIMSNINSAEGVNESQFARANNDGAGPLVRENVDKFFNMATHLNNISGFANSIPSVAEQFNQNLDQLTEAERTTTATPDITIEDERMLESVSSFNDETEAEAALQAGKINPGDIITINGETYRVD